MRNPRQALGAVRNLGLAMGAVRNPGQAWGGAAQGHKSRMPDGVAGQHSSCEDYGGAAQRGL